MNDDFRAAPLAVNSPEQRHALRCACEQVLALEEQDRAESTDGKAAFSLGRCEQRIAEVSALEDQLDRGHSTVEVGLGVAGKVIESLAKLLASEMNALADSCGRAPVGVHIRSAACLMWTLIALNAEVEAQLVPA
jgi:hypothetical protein